MISWSDVNSLQKKKLELQANLDLLLKSKNPTTDEINGLKAEILYLDKQIERILGSKEIERQKESRRQKSGVEQLNMKKYYEFKDKYKKMNKMKIATTRMIGAIESYQNNFYKQEIEQQDYIEEKGYSKIKV